MTDPLIEDYLEDDSILIIATAASVQQEMIKENGCSCDSFNFPDMLQSQILSDATHKQLQDILKENNDLKDTLRRNNEEMRHVFKELSEFQQEAFKSQAACKEEKKRMRAEKQTLENQLQEHCIETQNLQDELTKAQKINSNLASSVASLNEDLEKSKEELSDVTSQLKDRQSEMEALKSVRDKLSNQICTLLGQLDKQTAVYNEQLAAADQRYTARDSELQLLSEQLEQSRSQILKLNQEFESVSSEKGDLLQKLVKHIATFEEEHLIAQQKIGDLQNQLSALNKELSDPRTSELEVKAVLDETQKRADELQARTVHLEEENAKLLQDLQAMNKMTTPDIKEMGFSIFHQSEEQQDELQRLNMIVDQQKEQIEKLTNELEECKQDALIKESDRFFFVQTANCLSTATAILEDSNERYQSLGNQLEACEERLQNLGAGNSSELVEGLKKEVQELKHYLDQEREEKTAQKKTLEERIEELSQQYAQISAAWGAYESEQNNKAHENETLAAFEKRKNQETLDEAIAKNVSLAEECRERENEISGLKKKIDEDVEEFVALRAQIELNQADYLKVCEEKTAAEATIDHLKDKLSAAESQMLSLLQEKESHQSSSQEEQNQEEKQQQQEDREGEDRRGHQGQQEEEEQDNRQQQNIQEEEEPLPLQPVEVFKIVRGRNTVISRLSSTSGQEYESRRDSTNSYDWRPRSSMYEESSGEEGTFECPKCRMTYTSCKAVANHILGCQRYDY